MGRVSAVRISLETESAKLVTGLAKAQKRVKKFSNTVKREFDKVNSEIVENLQGALSGLAGSLVTVNEAFSEVGKQAKNSGVELEKFTELATAFEFAGASAEDLTGSISHFKDALRDASTGSKTYQDQFKAIGLSWQELEKIPIEEAFKRTVKAIGETTNAYTKNLAASDLLSGAQEKIGLILNSYSGDIEKLNKKLEDLGYAYDEDIIKKSSEASTSIRILTRQTQNLIANAFEPLLTKISETAQWLIAFNKDNKELSTTIIKITGYVFGAVAGLTALGLILKTVAVGLLAFKAPIAILTAGFLKLAVIGVTPFGLIAVAVGVVLSIVIAFRKQIIEAMFFIVDFLSDLWTSFKETMFSIWSGIVNSVRKAGQYISNIWNRVTKWFIGKAKKLYDFLPDGLKKALGVAGKHLSGFGGKIAKDLFDKKAWNTQLAEVKTGFAGIKDDLLSVISSIGSSASAVWDFNKSLASGYTKGLSSAFNSIKDLITVNLDKIIGSTGKSKEEIQGLIKEIENLNNKAKDIKPTEQPQVVLKDTPTDKTKDEEDEKDAINNSAKELRNSFSDSLAEGIVSGFQSGGVKDAIKGFGESLKQDAIQGLTDSLSKVLFDAFGVDSASGLIKSVFGFNKGGVVPGTGNTDSVPALLTPGEVVVNPKRGQSFGETNNITYNINAVDSKSFKQMVSQDPSFLYSVTEAGRRNQTRLGV